MSDTLIDYGINLEYSLCLLYEYFHTFPITDFIDELFEDIFGTFSIWHLFVALSMFVLNIFIALHKSANEFFERPTDYTCATPNISNPCDINCRIVKYDREFPKTITKEFELICDYEYLQKAGVLILSAGEGFGFLIFGMVADRCGRRIAFIASLVTLLISGIFSSFCRRFVEYCILRFLVGFSTAGGMLLALVIIIEEFGASYRNFIVYSEKLFFYIGYMMAGFISYTLNDWRNFLTSISLLSVLSLFSVIVIVESPRWLFATGQYNETAQALTSMAKKAGLPIEHITMQYYNLIKQDKCTREKATLIDLFHCGLLRYKVFSISIAMLINMTAYECRKYHCCPYNSIFVDYIINSGALALALLIAYILGKYVGRILTIILANVLAIAGLVALSCALQYNTQKWGWTVSLSSSVIESSISVSIFIMTIYAAEILPTVVRCSGMGLFLSLSVLSKSASVFVAKLEGILVLLPMIFFITLSTIVIMMFLFLPDTKDKPLPNNFEDKLIENTIWKKITSKL